MEPTTGPEEHILVAVGARLFARPVPTAQVLIALGFGAVGLVLLRHFLVDRFAPGRLLVAVLRRAEIALLALIVLGMVFLSAAQVVFRNLAGGGILWIDPLLRYLTLWIGFLGGAVATREGRHIQMDVLGRLLPPPAKRVAGLLTHLTAASTCAVLAESAYRHLASEYANNEREFLQLPTWILLGVIPVTLALMTYRFVDLALFPQPPPPEIPPLGERASLEAPSS